jgi:predicted NBD/HSP70 family sugar kinase
MSRPSILNLVRYCAPVLHRHNSRARGGPVALDPDAGVVVGVDIAHARARVAVSDLVGRFHPHPTTLDIERVGEDQLKDTDGTLRWVADVVTRWLHHLDRESDDVVGVGIALAGPVDLAKGSIRAAASLEPGREDWQLVSVVNNLETRLGWHGIPFLVENDANLGALAEHSWGAARRRPQDGRAYRNVAYVEWSRGIGAGLILNGELYRADGVAGELGHNIVDYTAEVRCPRCGNAGCLETVAGWSALSRATGAKKTDELIRRAGTKGDPAADVFATAVQHFAQSLGALMNLINPQLVVIGGSIGRQGYDLIRPMLFHHLKDHVMRPALKDSEIMQAQLTPRPALQGAIAFALRQHTDATGQVREPLLTLLQRKVGRAA